MHALRAMHNEIPLGYRKRDDQMTVWALSDSLSRQDMATATRLAKSRVDQIIRENYLASGSGKVAALMGRDAAPDSP